MTTADGKAETAVLASNLLELCQSVIANRTSPDDAFRHIVELKEKEQSLPSTLLDVLSVVEGDTTGDEEALKRFLRLLDLISESVIPDEILRSELETLEASQQANRQQLVRAKTRIFFKQSKFNLLREESEGYAKLITEFVSSGDSLSTSSLMTRMLSLIGTFNLDPNRVTDIILEAFEHSPTRKAAFIALLKEMKASPDFLCTLLAFKYSFYHKDGNTPFSLYQVTASLVEEQLVDLERMATFMTPKSSELLEAHKARAALASARAKKAETILSSNIAIDPHKSNSIGSDGVEPTNVVGISFSLVLAQQEMEDAKLRGNDSEKTQLGSQQRLGLCCALLEAGQWKLGKHLLDSFPEFYAVQASKRISVAITDMIDERIHDFFQLKCLSGFRERQPSSSTTSPTKVSSWGGFPAVWDLLSYVGPRIAYRPATLTKLVRLTTAFYEERERGVEGTGDQVAGEMMDMVDECLLPALSLSHSNAALSEEMWQLLKHFHYTHRYRLYGRWKSIHSLRHPEILLEKGKTVGRTKYVVKRLSKDTVRLMGRLIGKLCHSHPSVVFDCLLTQVQTFDNFIQPVVEAMKFLTSLEFDVLTYCVMEQLASPSKDALKASDGTTSTWLASLASLVGALFKKYNVELAGMLHYIANQLKNDKTFDLLILREMIEAMTGIENAAGATAEHVEAMSGGELLRNEAGSFSLARVNKRAMGRLRDAVLKEGLAAGLCILVAQQRDAVLHSHSDSIPLKLAGEMADQCRDTLVQFGSFLLEHVKMEDYAKMMPSTAELLNDLHAPLDASFFLTRPIHMHQIYTEYEKSKGSVKGSGEGSEGGRLDTKQKMALFKSAVDHCLAALSTQLQPRLQSLLAADINVQMYALFWMLSTRDIDVPVAAYEREQERIRKAMAALPDNLSLSKTKRVKEEDRLRILEQKLGDEQKKQLAHASRVKAFIRAEKENLFTTSGVQMQSFLQLCVLPRAIFSEQDAIFAAKMVLLLHQQRTPFFQTLLFIDKTFNDLLPVLSMLSENEANSLGRFLQILLSQCYRWHCDKSLFEKECDGFPGFLTKMKKKSAEKATEKGAEQEMGHGVHAKLFYKWQSRLIRTFLAVLSNPSAEYVHIRNILVVMNKLLPCFPVVTDLCEKTDAVVQELREREKGVRDDLALKAASYAGQLKIRKQPLHEEDFFGCSRPAAPKPNGTPVAAKKAAVPAANGESAKKKAKKEVEDSVANAENTPAPPSSTEKKRRTEKEKEVTVKEETQEEIREERRKPVRKEDTTVKEVKQESEEGEVPPSPPPKKIRKEEKARNGVTEDKSTKKKEKEKEQRTRDVEGPPLPPSMVKKPEEREREKDRERERERREDKNQKRSAPVDDVGEGKRAKKEKEKEKEKSSSRHRSPVRIRAKSPPSVERRRSSKETRKVHNQISF